MPNLPKISIITIVRNGAGLIERCLKSVTEQNYPNLEYIVLDGASTDGTQAIIERYRSFLSYYHSKPDKGPYDATLQAFAIATGDIVGLVHADDWLSPNALNTLGELALVNPEARLFCMGMQEHTLHAGGNMTKRRCYIPPPGNQFHLLDGLYCHGNTLFYHRELLEKQGFFENARYPQLADREFYMRLGMANTPKAATPDVLYHFLIHAASNSMSGDTKKTCQMLDETLTLANDYLAKEHTLDTQSLLADWHCFNAWRLAWFYYKAGKPLDTARLLIKSSLRFPLHMLRRFFHYRMPEAYRGSSA